MKHAEVSFFRRLVAGLLLLVSVFSFFIVLMIALKGGRWEFLSFDAKNPMPRLALGVAAFLGWFAVRTGFAGARDEWMNLLKRLVLLSLSLGTSLFAAELVLRAYLRHSQGLNTLERLKQAYEDGVPIRARSSHPLAAITRLSPNKKLIYELIPDLEMDFGGHELKQNAAGMRERKEYPVERLPSSVRIIGLGDSGMFGWGVEQDENYLAVLEERLNRNADGILYEVLNMAVPGYNTQQEVDALIAKGLACNPDIVVVGWCENDFALPGFVAPQKFYDEKNVSYLSALIFNRPKYRRLVLPDVQDRRRVSYDLIDPEVLEGEGLEGVRRSLEKLARLGREHDFNILIFGPMNDDIAGVCSEIGIASFNTLREIPEGTYPDEYGIYHPHPNPDGHAALAGYLADILREKGWLRMPRH
ncbi:MAG: SGNH/GDSL hydrolase family protein [Verrucomicrobia bacterium]|nr:SGNH/GDSL hydrolase family protein [Verrucomicrobiota bacterium]